MRRKATVALVAIMVVFSLAGMAFAMHLITGEVIMAHPSTRILIIDAQGREVTFSVVEDAAMVLADLQSATKVVVSYEADGKLTAQSATKG
ncbi:hypothetical protein [Candidatus Methylomirabilis sp.]|uniref:DUF1344 domain-containing protein n=1 Tax=Candidatus Methylomirabilis tolerans TaxID=3123416 RepID=A0AAJ1AJF1_9BACT|nr:hypothetical protein [Candidatus Methylomirabilis sp.]